MDGYDGEMIARRRLMRIGAGEPEEDLVAALLVGAGGGDGAAVEREGGLRDGAAMAGEGDDDLLADETPEAEVAVGVAGDDAAAAIAEELSGCFLASSAGGLKST